MPCGLSALMEVSPDSLSATDERSLPAVRDDNTRLVAGVLLGMDCLDVTTQKPWKLPFISGSGSLAVSADALAFFDDEHAPVRPVMNMTRRGARHDEVISPVALTWRWRLVLWILHERGVQVDREDVTGSMSECASVWNCAVWTTRESVAIWSGYRLSIWRATSQIHNRMLTF